MSSSSSPKSAAFISRGSSDSNFIRSSCPSSPSADRFFRGRIQSNPLIVLRSINYVLQPRSGPAIEETEKFDVRSNWREMSTRIKQSHSSICRHYHCPTRPTNINGCTREPNLHSRRLGREAINRKSQCQRIKPFGELGNPPQRRLACPCDRGHSRAMPT
jgi:hypothetical protein